MYLFSETVLVTHIIKIERKGIATSGIHYRDKILKIQESKKSP